MDPRQLFAAALFILTLELGLDDNRIDPAARSDAQRQHEECGNLQTGHGNLRSMRLPDKWNTAAAKSQQMTVPTKTNAEIRALAEVWSEAAIGADTPTVRHDANARSEAFAA
jgi:hypothetical protein